MTFIEFCKQNANLCNFTINYPDFCVNIGNMEGIIIAHFNMPKCTELTLWIPKEELLFELIDDFHQHVKTAFNNIAAFSSKKLDCTSNFTKILKTLNDLAELYVTTYKNIIKLKTIKKLENI